MGVSLWQIMVLALPIVLFIAAYFTTERDKYLNRMGYFIRFLILLFVGTTIVLSTSSLLAESAAGALVMLTCGIVIGYLNLRFQITRLQDIGWTPFLALLSYLPLINLVFLLVLFFVPGKQRVGAEVFS